jgi:endonuclease/exonuclease/phosphatase (EEP) superfamily protein YafD
LSVNASRSETVLVLQEKVQNLEKPVIVLGDFNKIPHTLSDILTPVINVSTTNTGSTLDQVYVSEDIHPCVHLSTPYFSDHQIIWIGVNLQPLGCS